MPRSAPTHARMNSQFRRSRSTRRRYSNEKAWPPLISARQASKRFPQKFHSSDWLYNRNLAPMIFEARAATDFFRSARVARTRAYLKRQYFRMECSMAREKLRVKRVKKFDMRDGIADVKIVRAFYGRDE